MFSNRSNAAPGASDWNTYHTAVNQQPQQSQQLQQPQIRRVSYIYATNNIRVCVNNANTSQPYSFFLNSYMPPMTPLYPSMFMSPPCTQNHKTQTNYPIYYSTTPILLTECYKSTEIKTIEKKENVSTHPEKSNNSGVILQNDLRSKLNKKRKIQDVQDTEKNMPDVLQEKVAKLSMEEVTIKTVEHQNPFSPKRNFLFLSAIENFNKTEKEREVAEKRKKLRLEAQKRQHAELVRKKMQEQAEKEREEAEKREKLTLEAQKRQHAELMRKKSQEQEIHMDVPPSTHVYAGCLKKLAQFTMCQDMWYIVVDANTLVFELTFVDELVKSDPSCRLMIPYFIFDELDKLCQWNYPPGAGSLAKKAKRYLAQEFSERKQVFGQKPTKTPNFASQVWISDGAIKCCKQLQKDNFFVVLLSDELRLRMVSSQLNIPSFSVKEITDYMAMSMKFNFQKVL